MTLKMRYNGYDFHDKFITVCESRPMPEFRDTSTVVSGADGEFFDDQTIGVREFEITLVARVKRQEQLRKLASELMNVLAVKKPSVFMFGDEVDIRGTHLKRLAVPTGTPDVEEFIRAGKWTIRFKQHDPYLYGTPRTWVIRDTERIIVGGNAPALPVVTVIPGGNSNAYGISSGGEGIVYEANFTSASVLTLDWESLTAKVSPAVTGNGLRVGSRFFTFDGTMEIAVAGAAKLTTIKWYERWL